MRRQLELWPTSQGPSQLSKIWKTLTRQQKQDVIIALANLISKTVCAGNIDQNQEESHER
jgi:hypothetical protein